jgi:Na+-exporting ATPase
MRSHWLVMDGVQTLSSYLLTDIQVLIMAMVASFAIKSWIEGGVITFVILLNIVVGFFQEFSAEKTLGSIRALGSPSARVIRNGESQVVPTGELVPGDIVELITGNTVPADLRLVVPVTQGDASQYGAQD